MEQQNVNLKRYEITTTRYRNDILVVEAENEEKAWELADELGADAWEVSYSDEIDSHINELEA